MSDGTLEKCWTMEHASTWLVTCPDCAFRFSAEHGNADSSGWSCPNCAEVTGRWLLAEARAEASDWRARETSRPGVYWRPFPWEAPV